MLSRKATLLVGEVLALANKILPSPAAARLQVSPLLPLLSDLLIRT